MATATLDFDDCGLALLWPDADGLFADGEQANCVDCGAKWRVEADGERAWLEPDGE